MHSCHERDLCMLVECRSCCTHMSISHKCICFKVQFSICGFAVFQLSFFIFIFRNLNLFKLNLNGDRDGAPKNRLFPGHHWPSADDGAQKKIKFLFFDTMIPNLKNWGPMATFGGKPECPRRWPRRQRGFVFLSSSHEGSTHSDDRGSHGWWW